MRILTQMSKLSLTSITAITLIFFGIEAGGTVKSDSVTIETIPISGIEELQKIGNDADYPLDANYKLTADIDAAETANWNGGKGFDPIGNFIDYTETEDNKPSIQSFSGHFDGQGHTIDGLHINRPKEDGTGLFAYIEKGSTIKNLELANLSLSGKGDVGGIAGIAGLNNKHREGNGKNNTAITNCTVSGKIEGNTFVGAILGMGVNIEILSSKSTGSISGTVDIEAHEFADGKSLGGLIGFIDGGVIQNSESRVDLSFSGNQYDGVGGLVGMNRDTKIRNSHATGDVEGWRWVGGLVANNVENSVITASYATGNVKALRNVAGGLVSSNEHSIIRESFATGTVIGFSDVGGLVGTNQFFPTHNGTVGDSTSLIESSYATGDVHPLQGHEDQSTVGGLVGVNETKIHSSFAVGEISVIKASESEAQEQMSYEERKKAILDDIKSIEKATGNEFSDEDKKNILKNRLEQPQSSENSSKSINQESAGGLVGERTRDNGEATALIKSYWNIETTGQEKAVGDLGYGNTKIFSEQKPNEDYARGLTKDQMTGKNAKRYMNWLDFEETWQVVPDDYPALQWESK